MMIPPDRSVSPIILIEGRVVLNGDLVIWVEFTLYLVHILLWRARNLFPKMAIIVINS